MLENYITVCYGKNCRIKNSESILNAVEEKIIHPNCPISALLEFKVNVKLCNKFCDSGPWVKYNSNIFLNMTENKAIKLIEAIQMNDIKAILEFNPINDDRAKSS